MKQIAVGVIGAGNMGIHHVRNYHHLQSAKLVGVVDQNPSRLQYVQKNFQVPVYTNIEDILPLVDAVSIVTPTTTHFPLAMRFLQEGKHVLLEKPMAATLEEAEMLKHTAERMGVVLSIGHIERFNPVVNELIHILREQRPHFIEIRRESPYDPRIFDTDVVSDLMIHDIDLLFYLLHETVEPKSVLGLKVHSTSFDLVNAQLLSDSGILVNINTSRITEQKVRQWRFVLPQILIEADLFERKLYLTRRTSVEMQVSENKPDLRYKQEQLVEKVLVPNYEPLQLELQDFISSIGNGSKPRVSALDGIRALSVIQRIQALATSNLED